MIKNGGDRMSTEKEKLIEIKGRLEGMLTSWPTNRYDMGVHTFQAPAVREALENILEDIKSYDE